MEKEFQISIERTFQHGDKSVEMHNNTAMQVLPSLTAEGKNQQGMHLKDLICLSLILIQINLLKMTV